MHNYILFKGDEVVSLHATRIGAEAAKVKHAQLMSTSIALYRIEGWRVRA